MKKARSYCVITEPGKPDIEFNTFTCAHCNRIVRPPSKKPRANEMLDCGYCGRCDKNICGGCCDEMGRTLKCAPFEAKLEAMESKGALQRALTG